MVLGEINVFPDADCRTALPGPRSGDRGVPLSPEQSEAVLRERCLGFLFGFPSLPIRLDGVIWQSNGELPVDADYLEGVDRDVNRAGLRHPGLDAQRAVARPARATARSRPDEGPQLRPAVGTYLATPRQHVGQALIDAFGDAAATPAKTCTRSWGTDPWTQGYVTAWRPGDVMAVGPLHGKSEPPFYVYGSDQWLSGHMEGAVRTGRGVAREVLTSR